MLLSTDEQDCFAEDDFRCTTTGGCIRRVHVCDGKQHCSDNSDEENCCKNFNFTINTWLYRYC